MIPRHPISANLAVFQEGFGEGKAAVHVHHADFGDSQVHLSGANVGLNVADAEINVANIGATSAAERPTLAARRPTLAAENLSVLPIRHTRAAGRPTARAEAPPLTTLISASLTLISTSAAEKHAKHTRMSTSITCNLVPKLYLGTSGMTWKHNRESERRTAMRGGNESCRVDEATAEPTMEAQPRIRKPDRNERRK